MILKIVIILYVMKILKIPTRNKILRLALTTIISTLMECMVLLIIGNYTLYRWLSLLVICPLTVYILIKRIINIVRVWISTIFITMLIGGATYAADGIVSENITIGCLFCGIAIYPFLTMWLDNIRYQKNIYNITVHEKGKRTVIRGLYDSGNMLRKQPENVPVHIGSEKVFSIIGDDKIFYDIPYKSLGNERDIVKGCYFERIVIECGGSQRILNNVLIAKASANLLESMAYDIILNEAVFNDSQSVEYHTKR